MNANPPFDRAAAAWLLTAIAAGVALRAHGLGSEALWLDEAYSANYAELPFRELVIRLGREATPPLYYVLLGGWTRLFGSSETAVRALSAAFSIAGIAAIAAFLARFASWRAAAIGAWLAALTPLHVYYAQEARMYSLLALLATALVVLAARALERPSFAVSLAAALVSLAALWTHNVALWLVAGVSAAFLSIARDRVSQARWLVAHGVAALLYLPWLAVLIAQTQRQGEVLAWFAERWQARSLVRHLVDSLLSFALGPYPGHLAITSPVRGAALASAGAVAIAGYAAMRMRERAPVRLVAIAFAVALVLSLAYSAGVQPVHIAGRTDQALLPLFVILLALGIEAIRPVLLGRCVLVLFLVGALAMLVAYYGNGAKSGSRKWLSALIAEAHAGDVVVATGLTHPELQYALRRAGIPARLESFPRSVADHPGYVNYDALRAQPEQLAIDAHILGTFCEDAVAHGDRAFVVLVPGDIHRALYDELQRLLGSPRALPGEFVQAGTGAPVQLLKFERPLGDQ